MPTPPPGRDNLRRRIAALAARLIAEDGINEYPVAKRKAAQQLGLPSATHLPENSEVEEELRLYLRLFQSDEYAENLSDLRQTACQLLETLEQFTAYLSGAVLDGSAGRHAEIDIQLYTDSAKDVEIFLLNRGIDFRHSEPRTPRAEAVLSFQIGPSTANLIIYPHQEERVVHRSRDGRPRPRARLADVRRLLAEGDDNAVKNTPPAEQNTQTST